MPEANEYMFTHKELVELMVKTADIHEGRWVLSITFGFGAMSGGPTPEQAAPTGIVAVHSIGIRRAQSDAPEVLTVDAAVVNPTSTENKQPATRSRQPFDRAQ